MSTPLIIGEATPGTPLPKGIAGADAPVAEVAPAPARAGATPAALGGERVTVHGRVHDAYFVQQVTVGNEFARLRRVDAFRAICAGKRVLHVGCVDWPITDVAASLHVQLDGACAALDGFDIHAEAFGVLRPHLRGRLFSDWAEVTEPYDIVLVPEVLEHVPDVEGFLGQLDRVRCDTFVLTVPDAFQCAGHHFAYHPATSVFQEVVHPDHNCWYTPYTIGNVIRKFTPWRVDGVWFFNGISLLVMASRPAPR